MAESALTTELETLLDDENTVQYEHVTHEVNIEDSIDILFGGIDIPRSRHVYGDGVIVEILNLSNDDTSDNGLNGARVFYRIVENKKEVLCRFPGYSIDKHVLATNERDTTPQDTTTAVEQILEPLMRDVPEEKLGAICLTNDGPMIMVFKVAGTVRIHMMRSAAHGFDAQFEDDFSSQYNGAKFQDLFPTDCETSKWCHLFRQGSRCSAMEPALDEEWRTMLYLGGLECNMVAIQPNSSLALLAPVVSTLSVDTAVKILRSSDMGLVCYRHPGGEVQLLSEQYLQRVAIMTGHSVDELVGIADPHPEDDEPRSSRAFERRVSALSAGELSIKLVSSRFPRLLDLFSLYILCGVNSQRRLATICGFSVRLDANTGRILANPKRGFYNFCRAAGVTARQELTFPATPSAMRLAIRRIVLSGTLPSKTAEVEQQFNEYESTLSSVVPHLIMRTLSGSSSLRRCFELAFGSSVQELLGDFPIPPRGTPGQLRAVRTALLLVDPYRLVTLARFAQRYLLNQAHTPLAMRERDLIDKLSVYSVSSRRRRMVSESLTIGHDESAPVHQVA